MPIDVAQATGAEPRKGEISWTHKDVILYHLGVGAGTPATGADELRYTYEKSLQVLPTFATVAGTKVGGSLSALPGIDINLAAVLHGGQEVVIHNPLPAKAKNIQATSRIADVWDKGKAAVIVLESSATLEDGTPLYDSRAEIFVRGEGGFGGERGPVTKIDVPERARTTWSTSRRARTRRCCTACPATGTRCTPTRSSPSAPGSTRRSCTACARTA